jgi:uncharacterized protein YkwD
MQRTIFSFIALLIFFSSCELEHKDDSMAEIISKQKMLDMVNDIRIKGCDCGGTVMPPVGKLEWDYELERAALAHSIDMNVNNYFSHVSLDGSSFADRIKGTDYEGSPGGENIASGYRDEDAVFNGWKNSPGHCKNMMNGGFTDIAVGRSGNYWTMVFGRK